MCCNSSSRCLRELALLFELEDLLHGLYEIGTEVLKVFEADRDADQTRVLTGVRDDAVLEERLDATEGRGRLLCFQ